MTLAAKRNPMTKKDKWLQMILMQTCKIISGPASTQQQTTYQVMH